MFHSGVTYLALTLTPAAAEEIKLKTSYGDKDGTNYNISNDVTWCFYSLLKTLGLYIAYNI